MKVVGVRPLQARGVIFWQCNNALTGHANRFAREMQLDPKQVREELIAGLNPGVKLVPRPSTIRHFRPSRSISIRHNHRHPPLSRRHYARLPLDQHCPILPSRDCPHRSVDREVIAPQLDRLHVDRLPR